MERGTDDRTGSLLSWRERIANDFELNDTFAGTNLFHLGVVSRQKNKYNAGHVSEIGG